jgi:hypothetical protein
MAPFGKSFEKTRDRLGERLRQLTVYLSDPLEEKEREYIVKELLRAAKKNGEKIQDLGQKRQKKILRTKAVFSFDVKASKPFCDKKVSTFSVDGHTTGSIPLSWYNHLLCTLTVWLWKTILAAKVGGPQWPFTMCSSMMGFVSSSGLFPRTTLVVEDFSINMMFRGMSDTSFGVVYPQPFLLANAIDVRSCEPNDLIRSLST